MNIPKSYEALAADLASEKFISKTLLGQKEAYMMLADKGRIDLATWKQKACEAAEREAALREELRLAKSLQTTTDAIVVMVDGQRDHWIEKHNALQQRLTVAGQRIGELESILGRLIKDCLASDFNEHWDSFISAEAALKPAAVGEWS